MIVRRPSLAAFIAYCALSIVMTWPLALGLARDVPGDLGDSLLNMWILSWGVEHVPRLLTGTLAWAEFWNGNIFHPEPLALTFSEHLFGQTLQMLPVYWLTGNIILCYNVTFILTFALSAFGTYLLVRDLTGDHRAAFLAGLVYGFLPYRIASVPHVQVMSSQWMPFALYGLNRWVSTPNADKSLPRHSSQGSARAAAGGTAALVMQNWSCGYYLLYFAPFVPLFVLHRMWTSNKLGDLRTWIGLCASAAATLALTLPFLFPYAEAQRRFGMERPFGEVVQDSANVWSYVTASENVWLWGKSLRFYPHGEGETFLGFVPWVLAIVGLGRLVVSRVWDGGGPGQDLKTSRRQDLKTRAIRVLTALLLFAVVSQFIALMSAVLFGGFEFNILGIAISARTPQRLLLQFVIALALLLGISPRARRVSLELARSPFAFFAAATILAMWLSLGPLPNAGQAHVSGLGLYGLLYDYVPGFNGVRVPARYAMIAGLFLAVLSGFGVAALRRGGSLDPPIAVLLGLLILIEGAAIPMEMNRTWGGREATPPPRVYPAAQAPSVYQQIAALPAGTAITEFPFGDPAWEIRYVYYAGVHFKPITNGYSGAFPPGYKTRLAVLQDVRNNPDAAWKALLDSGTTHVVVHDTAFANAADAIVVKQWVESRGATRLTHQDNDTLYAIR